MSTNRHNVRIVDDSSREVLNVNCFDYKIEHGVIMFYDFTESHRGFSCGDSKIFLIYGIKQGDIITPTKLES